MKILSKIKLFVLATILASCSSLGIINSVFAESTMNVSPMSESIILSPGEHYDGYFKVSNPNDAKANLDFATSVGSFSQGKDEKTGDDYGSVDIESVSAYNQIKDWVTVVTESGSVAPNETAQVHYTIDVPKDAPAGGQYATIIVRDNSDENQEGEGISIVENRQIAYIIYAEIAGETREEGLISQNSIPAFILNGKLTASSLVRNNGNTHTNAEYTLQVWPLFSDEEICTNEESSEKSLVMPETERYHAQTCDLPMVGIFKAKQTASIFGESSVAEKMVVACPIWLLVLILIAICAIVVWLISRSKKRKNNSQK